jgi:hypothetical protein
LSLAKKLLDDALAGLPRTDDQRRNQMGQFHGPKTGVPVINPVLPELDFLPGTGDEPDELLDGVLLPEIASADDGCEDGLGDF